jgi:hypothetical protein
VPLKRFVAVVAALVIGQVVFDGSFNGGVGAAVGKQLPLVFLAFRLLCCDGFLLGGTPDFGLIVQFCTLCGCACPRYLVRWFAELFRCYRFVSPSFGSGDNRSVIKVVRQAFACVMRQAFTTLGRQAFVERLS